MKKLQKVTSIPILAMLLASGGAMAGYASLASAEATDTNTGSSSESRPKEAGANFDPSKGGHMGKNGSKEELLTGDTAQKVTAAALTAVPGGVAERVETDVERAFYEAHMKKADGSHVTVKLDANFNVTATEDGFDPRR